MLVGGFGMANSISDNKRDELKALRQGLLQLHKMLLDLERVGYERSRGRIGNSYEFLQLVLKDPCLTPRWRVPRTRGRPGGPLPPRARA